MSATAKRNHGSAVTIAVTSGKGGVGKTSVVVNLAVSIARLGRRVAILDADFGLGNVDVQLGLTPAWHLGHVLAGDKDIHEIVVTGPAGVRIVPAGSGLRELTALTPSQWQRLAGALEEIRAEVEFLIVDTAAGISSNVIDLLRGLEHVLVVTSMEPGAIVDAYAMMKLLTLAEPERAVNVLVNGVRDGEEAELVFRQLDVAAERFLHCRPRYQGYVPFDPAVRDAVLVQQSTVDLHPQCAASRSFRVLASRLVRLSPEGGTKHRLVPPAGARATAGASLEVERCA
ncbi:MAG: MinD/ParA family protein [Acidobacteria bacterium]|nr:MAG: MinD/ParA family protein [Acidobacteriota bacterium]